MVNRTLAAACVAAFLAGALVSWLLMRTKIHDGVGRMDKLIRDSTEYAGWVQKRDEQLDSINAVFHMKDDSLSWTREQLEYALHHRRASAIRDNDSLHRAIEAELGLLRQRNR